ncbi:unnamed protein product [Urochloa humidicola]
MPRAFFLPPWTPPSTRSASPSSSGAERWRAELDFALRNGEMAAAPAAPPPTVGRVARGHEQSSTPDLPPLPAATSLHATMPARELDPAVALPSLPMTPATVAAGAEELEEGGAGVHLVGHRGAEVATVEGEEEDPAA